MNQLKIDHPGLKDMIRQRIAVMGFRTDEVSDVQQEVYLNLLKSNVNLGNLRKAKPRTFLTSAIDNQLKKIINKKKKERSEDIEELISITTDCYQTPLELYLDLENAVQQLPPFEQDVCERLKEGQSINEISTALNCCWRTVDSAVCRIRFHFERLGLNGIF